MRQSCRALLLDRGDRILLAQHRIDEGTVWAAVGGGVELGETLLDALERELHEEAGLDLARDARSSPVEVWTQSVEVPEARKRGSAGVTNHYFLVRVGSFDPAPGAGPDEPGSHAADGIVAMRWWSVEEISSAATEPGVLFSPRALAVHLKELLAAEAAGQLPSEPVPLGL